MDRVAPGEIPQEIKIPEPELVSGVAGRDILHEMLDLVIHSDRDGKLEWTKIERGVHADGR